MNESPAPLRPGRAPRRLPGLLPSLLLCLTACGGVADVDDVHGTAEPTIAQLGAVHLDITTDAPDAQRWFDRGLAWCYAFHHQEAIRCFEAAAAADPECAMAQWGLAYAAGPHINNMEMTDEAAERANLASRRAIELADGATALERQLIAAVARRYAAPPPKDRAALDRAYADAMRTVYEAHPDHDDVGALFAESLMNLRPWDLYTKAGEPQPGTDEVIRVLEATLARHPENPQANHLYIHATEASLRPERAVPSAERLVDLAPAAGHLTHMPAHVFIRVGRYEEAAAANRRAIAADLATVARTGREGFYELYRAHNYHFLAFAAMFAGREAEAVAAADDMVREMPMAAVQQMPAFFEGFLSLPVHVLVRFGRWDDVLALPEPPEWQKSVRAVRHYGRGIALAALGRTDEALAEQRAFRAAVAEVPEDWSIGNNPTRTVLAVGDAFLAGEVGFRAGDRERAFESLREAVRLADELRYDEPWGWMMPPRHALGALLLEADRTAEAEAVYREDLAHHPENGWALHGLAECLRRRGAEAEAAAAKSRFDAAWRDATVQIGASCFCRRGG